MAEINFFTEDVIFELQDKKAIQNWIQQTIEREGFELLVLNFIFCSDEYLHQINVEYLDHDTFTDIITFDNSDSNEEIEGDIFISIDRIEENSKSHAHTFEEELHRVIIHGVLHLCGYMDKTDKEKQLMREKENEALNHFKA
jgi:probable rRNA maturation factor